MVSDPRLPCQREVDEHMVRSHPPCLNWCGICIAAKGADADHRGCIGSSRQVSELCFDYAFPGNEYGCKVVT